MRNDDVTSPPALSLAELEAFRLIIEALNPLSEEARRRLISSAATLLRIERIPWQHEGSGATPLQSALPMGAPKGIAPFSQEQELSPKEFLFEKQPKSDVERVACLGYYLTHYRATPHFKTSDLSMLNTEAAQPKFSNAAAAAGNAIKLGYLVPSTKGHRQISAAGERFVLALPDRVAAKEALTSVRRRQRAKKNKSSARSQDQ